MNIKTHYLIVAIITFVAGFVIQGCGTNITDSAPQSQPLPNPIEKIGDAIKKETWMSKQNQISSFLRMSLEVKSASKEESSEAIIKIQNRSNELYFDIEKISLSIKHRNSGKPDKFVINNLEVNILEKISPGMSFSRTINFEKGDEILTVMPIAQSITIDSR